MIEEALLKPMSDDRVKEVDKRVIDEWVRNFLKRDDIKKNSDGSFDVKGSVDLANMNLTELPMKFGKVNGDFVCYSNKLTTLEGAPNYVGRDFYCSRNNLASLEGAPKEVGGLFICYFNKEKFTEKDVKDICNVGKGVHV